MIYALIHSPVTGPYAWREVANELHARGHEAIVPDLRAVTPPYWSSYAALIADALLPESQDRAVTLVGHSAAGLLLPLVGDRLPNDAERRCIFVDASLPARPGQRLVDVIAEAFGVAPSIVLGANAGGELPPWGEAWPLEVWEGLVPNRRRRELFRNELVAMPLALYEGTIPSARAAACGMSSYLLFSEAYRSIAERAESAGWRVRELPGQHLHMLVDPSRVADEIVALAG